MTAQKDHNAPQTAGRPLAARVDSPDLKVLTRALKEFNVSRTHAAMYPPEHPQIARSIERAYEYLSTLSEKTPSLTLGIAKDCLMFGGECLDPKSGVFREFSNFLSSRDIVSVTFLSGLTKEEIVEFHRLLNIDPEEIRNTGGILEMMGSARFSHIRIQAVDYRYFHLTEEEEISQERQKSVKATSGGLWQDFVHHLVRGRLSREERGISQETWENIDPLKLALFINEYRLDPQAIVSSYEEFLRAQTQQFCSLETIAKLETLVQNLRPELKKQFLSITFDHVQDQSEKLLSGFSEDFIVEMVKQAREESKGISPTLLSMVHSLANIEDAIPASPDIQQVPGGVDSATSLSQDEMKKLFDREDYEAYVDEEYSATLAQLSDGLPQGPTNIPDAESELEGTGKEGTTQDSEKPTVPSVELAHAVEDGQLAIRICEMLLVLLGQEMDTDDYEVFSQKLVEYVPELLEMGAFELVLQIIALFRRQATDAPDAQRPMAMKAIQDMTGSAIASKAVEAYRRFRGRKGREATALVYAIGSSCVPGLMDLYLEDDSAFTNKAVEQLLLRFLTETLAEACSRLSDHREQALRNLLSLIQHHGNADAIPRIRPLLNHPSHWVRMDALSTLLFFGDPVAVESLRKALRSPFFEESLRAIGLAGLCRVEALVDDLSKMIKVTAFRRSHYRRNEEIIKALGKIGDPKVMPLLERIARRSWAIFPSEAWKVKLALFESLGEYPLEHLSTIMNVGRESKDFRIRTIANAFFKKDSV
jgi:hypothetical protein